MENKMHSEGEFDGHPTQAHADHAVIMKAHGIVNHPERMAAVHALHKQSMPSLEEFYKGKKKGLEHKEKGESAAEEKAESPKEEIEEGGI